MQRLLRFTLIVLMANLVGLTGSNARAQVDTRGRFVVGAEFPSIALPDLEGKLRSLNDFRGKKTLVFHFASW